MLQENGPSLRNVDHAVTGITRHVDNTERAVTDNTSRLQIVQCFLVAQPPFHDREFADGHLRVC
jgi:hypothetical protein